MNAIQHHDTVPFDPLDVIGPVMLVAGVEPTAHQAVFDVVRVHLGSVHEPLLMPLHERPPDVAEARRDGPTDGATAKWVGEIVAVRYSVDFHDLEERVTGKPRGFQAVEVDDAFPFGVAKYSPRQPIFVVSE